MYNIYGNQKTKKQKTKKKEDNSDDDGIRQNR